MIEATLQTSIALSNGGNLAVWLDQESGSRLVCLLHGFGADHAQALDFTPPASDLGDGWCRAAFDLPFHGESRLGSPDGGLAGVVDAVSFGIQALLERTGAQDLALVGLSLGAEVALRLAASKPVRVDTLVLVRPAKPEGDADLPVSRAHKKLATIGRTVRSEDARAQFVTTPEYRDIVRSGPNLAATMLALLDQPDHELLTFLDDVAGSPDVAPAEVARVGCPTLVLSTTDDPGHPTASARALVRGIPGAELQMLPTKALYPRAYQAALPLVVSQFLTRAR